MRLPCPECFHGGVFAKRISRMPRDCSVDVENLSFLAIRKGFEPQGMLTFWTNSITIRIRSKHIIWVASSMLFDWQINNVLYQQKVSYIYLKNLLTRFSFIITPCFNQHSSSFVSCLLYRSTLHLMRLNSLIIAANYECNPIRQKPNIKGTKRLVF